MSVCYCFLISSPVIWVDRLSDYLKDGEVLKMSFCYSRMIYLPCYLDGGGEGEDKYLLLLHDLPALLSG